MSEKYKGYRMPKSIIWYAIRRHYQFKLSLRDASEILLERGIEVSYETIRNWCTIGGPCLFQNNTPQERLFFRRQMAH